MASKINYLGNGRGNDSRCLSNQCSIAVSPRSCGILVYKLMTSNDTNIVFSFIFVGILFRKSILSRIKLGTCWHNGFKIKSTKLFSLCVGDLGPATIGPATISPLVVPV